MVTLPTNDKTLKPAMINIVTYLKSTLPTVGKDEIQTRG